MLAGEDAAAAFDERREEFEFQGAEVEGNARLKATQLAPVLGEWVLGEDSGLCVPALGGAPGVYSARYAGEHGNDAANNAKLLAALAGKTGDERAAYYVSAVVLANPAGEVIATAEGRCWGLIGTEARGTGGFGYDPLFTIPEYHATFGELSATASTRPSARRRNSPSTARRMPTP